MDMMEYIGFILVLFGATLAVPHVNPKWPLQSMTYNWELTSLNDEFSLRGTTYFSTQRQAYRYDISKGMYKLYIYPARGTSYFYYPTSDFVNNQFNVTKCYAFPTPKRDRLPNPLPSLNGFNRSETGHPYSEMEKYTQRSYYGIFEDEYEMWVKTNDARSGINKHPVRFEMKEWVLSDFHYAKAWREALKTHTVFEYFGFKAGEQQSSVWEHPHGECQEPGLGETPQAFDIQSYASAVALDIGVPSEIVHQPIFRQSANVKYYGRINVQVPDEEDPWGLLLPFPYTAAEYEAMAKELPESFDWRNFGAVTHVKDQRNCGSCWAHGAVGALEGAYFRKHNQLVVMSEQAMVDCAGSSVFNLYKENNTTYTVDGCYGGYERSGFAWVHKAGGIPLAEEYGPYQEINGYCRVTNQTSLVAQLEGYYHIPNNTDAMKVALVKLGPLVVSVDATPFCGYTHGVISGNDCHCSDLTHSVLVVGYGESNEHGPYWIIKDSLGINQGMNGYELVSAVGNCICILDEAYFPKLK